MSMSLDGFVGSDRRNRDRRYEGAELKQGSIGPHRKDGGPPNGPRHLQQMSSYWPQSDDEYAPREDIPRGVSPRRISEKRRTCRYPG